MLDDGCVGSRSFVTKFSIHFREALDMLINATGVRSKLALDTYAAVRSRWLTPCPSNLLSASLPI